MASDAKEKEILSLKSTVESQARTIESLREQLRLALLRQFGKSSEKLVDQLDLPFTDEDVPPAENQSETQTKVEAHVRKTGGRKALSPDLPRDHHYHDLSAKERLCSCGHEMKKIGEDVSERLNVTPPRLWVDCHHKAKYACSHCQGVNEAGTPAVITADGPPTLIPGSILSPELLAFIWVNKFCDHLPFYRQEVGFERIGASISRQDMSNWTQKVSANLEPLIRLLENKIREGPLIQMDETPVKVLKLDHTGSDGQGYMWLALGGTEGAKIARYWFAPGRANQNAKTFLEGFSGYLQTDGFKAYDAASLGMPWTLVGCWAHARRKFVEADKVAGSSITKDALGRIRKIYDLEKSLREELKQGALTETQFQEKRSQILGSYLVQFRQWLEETAARTLPSGKTGEAFTYTLGQWEKLIRFISHPAMTPDNNRAENAIRPFVIGRKNWLFHGNDQGAEASCRVFTLIETAKLHGLEPYAYLKAVLTALPSVMKSGDWDSLLPSVFAKA